MAKTQKGMVNPASERLAEETGEPKEKFEPEDDKYPHPSWDELEDVDPDDQ